MKKHIAFMVSCIMLAVCFCFPVNAAVSPTAVTTVDAPLRTYDSKVEVRGQAIQYQAYKTDQMVVQQGVQNNGTTINFLYSEYDLWDTTIHCSYTLTNTSADVVTFDSGALYSNLYVMMSDVNASTNSAVSYQGYYIDNVTNGAVLVSTSNGVNVFRMDNIRSGNQIVILPYQSVSFSYDFHAIWYGVDDGTTSNPNTGVDIQNYTNTVSYSSGGVTSIDFDTFISYQESYEAYFAYHVDQIWTTLQTLVSQGVIDQQKYDSIVSSLLYHGITINYNGTSDSGFTTSLYGDINSIQVILHRHLGSAYLVDSGNLNIMNSTSNTSVAVGDNVYCIPVYYNVVLSNFSDKTYVDNATTTSFLISNVPTFTTNGTMLGYDLDIIDSKGMLYYSHNSSPGSFYFRFDDYVEGKRVFPSGDIRYITIKYNCYFVYHYDSNSVGAFTCNTTFGTPNTNINFSLSIYNQSLFASWAKNFADIRDRIQQLIDGNTSVNQDISDESGSVSDTQEQIHDQEQQWYSDNEAAIEATGLSNFEFSSGELDGLTQLRLQFSQVWGALGDWTLVYIFVLSLSLATFILRHRPTTKAQQRMTDSEIRAAESRRRSEASHRARLDTNELYAKYYYGDYK